MGVEHFEVFKGSVFGGGGGGRRVKCGSKPSYHLVFCYLITHRLVFRTVEILWNLLEFGSKQEVS